MRIGFSVVFSILIIALIECIVLARRSRKPIGDHVAFLLFALLPPMIGNIIIIVSSNQLLSTIGCYIYFIGMDFAICALIRFTLRYCSIKWSSKTVKYLVYSLIAIDVTSLLLNPVFGHAFAIEGIMVNGAVYYRLVPFLGQTFHRIICYGGLVAAIAVFVVKIIRSPRIYSEKYTVILAAMLFTSLWETFYIFSRTPIDRSMIGFGVFGLLVYFFSIRYRPMRLMDRMLANIASEMPEAIFFFDDSGQCIWTNSHGIELTGISEGRYEKVPERLHDIFGDYEHANDEWNARHVLGEDDNAEYYYLEKHVLTDEKGRTSGSFLTVRDNTKDERALKKQRFNATHDSLTGLYNKDYLYECIQEEISAHPDKKFLVGFLNVSGFKLVNDIYGNDFGDYTLQCIAEWLRICVPPSCLIGRLTGDTFGIGIQADKFDRDYAEEVLSDFVVENDMIQHHILIHMGIYEVSETDIDVAAMFDRARMALTTIKEDYNIHVAFYDEDMRNKVLWDQHITTQLTEALERNEIMPYLQPMVDNNGNVVGAEALVRWIHPEHGFLSPASFIPVFEKNGMIAELDKHMWRCVCEILSKWEKQGIDKFISVNISPKDFYFMDVSKELKNIVSEFGVSPSRLRIEITETVMMSDIEKRISILDDLKSDGFVVEMDDFGSGYSSLNLLKDMPVDVIKIDMMFLNKTRDEFKARRILHNIIKLSDDLKIESLTEGVESESQYLMLSEMGCKLFQGYYFAKPMPAEEFEKNYLGAEKCS